MCNSGLNEDFVGEGGGRLVDCPTQLTLMTWICQVCFITNTSEKYERTRQGNLLGDDIDIVSWKNSL